VVLVQRGQLIDVLEDAGLSPYQADAYVSLLKLGAAPVTDVAEDSGVPDPRIYDVLRDLEADGYIELYEQESLHARAYSLEGVIEDLETRASRFTEAAAEIERRWEQPAMEETSVSIVNQFDTVLKRASEWIRAADNQVQISLSPEQFERLRPALRDATDAGVSVHLSVSSDDGAFFREENLVAVCTEARDRRLPSPFVAIVDRTKTCFTPHEGSTNEYGVLVDDRGHTYVFHWFFLTTQWDIWEEVYRAADDELPTDYIDIRYCIRDISPVLDAGDTVRVSIEGIDLETGEERTVEGAVADVLLSESVAETTARSVAGYGGQVSLVVDAADGHVEVGGWGSMVEEMEAHRITVLSVE
jgi:sugar-specific transcriptional regulator TrmB